MKKRAIAVALLMVFLAACTSGNPTPLPEGVQTVSGTLQAVPLSLKRRGTHALLSGNGTIASYVESRSVDLTELDGHEVRLRGTFEKNLTEDLPFVFVVESVLEGGEEALRPWSVPSLKLSLKLPKSWEGDLKGNVATFTGSGGTTMLLEIRSTETLAASSSSAAPVSSSARTGFTVGLRPALAWESADGRQWIVKTEPRNASERATVFTFRLAPDIPAAEQITQFTKLLRSAQFTTGGSQMQPMPSSGSARSAGPAPFPGISSSAPLTGEGNPCGGPAGILCPAGFYCRITDMTVEAGICAKR